MSRIESSDQLGGNPAAISCGPSLLTTPGTSIRKVSLPPCRWPCCLTSQPQAVSPRQIPSAKEAQVVAEPSPRSACIALQPDRDEQRETEAQPKFSANSRTGIALAHIRLCESFHRLSACAGRPGDSIVMLYHVEHVAVRGADEEAGDAPLLGGQRMHDLVSALLGLAVGGLDIVDLD